MANKKTQLNIDNARGVNASGFVVDLRTKLKNEYNQETKKIEEHAVQELKLLEREAKKLEKRIKTIEPNLLKIDSQRKYRNSQIKIPKPSRKTGRSFFFIPNLTATDFTRFFRRDKSLWSKVFKHQSDIFKRAAKINLRPVKRNLELEKRAARAETTVAWYRSIFSFVIVLILIIVPIKLLSYFELLDLHNFENKIIGHSQLALNNLLAASDDASKMDFKGADSQFKNAGDNFLAAQDELDKINDSVLSLAALSNDPKLKLAAESKKFLRAGAIISSLGRNLVLASDSLFGPEKENFSVALDNFTYYGELAVADSKDLKQELDKINPNNLPPEYRDKFLMITKQTGYLSDNLETFVSGGTKLKELLGATQDKRYLLVFQNNSELRASGGFLGSYALVDIRNGKIRNLEVPGGGSYDTEGAMSVLVAAPKPLWLVNPLWHFWDANWWADWPTTAKNLMWFYEKSDGPTVDGVISVTPTVVENLLKITGPIDLTKEYGLTIDADNFLDVTQKIVEQKNLAKTNPEAIIGIPASSTVVSSDLPIKQGLDLNSNNKPKKIIGDLMAKIFEILPKKLSKESLAQILGLFESSLSEKQVLFYFKDPGLEAEVSSRNWGGEIKDTTRDYLMVVNTNIAGQKSDLMMTEKINHLSEVSSDGSIINTLTITRTHNGVKNEAMTGVRNVDWLRIYVPKGSELLYANGFKSPDAKYLNQKPDPSWQELPVLENENRALVQENTGTKVYEENNKTVFANWAMVDPGESVVITIKYRLPFNFLDQVKEDTWLTKLNILLNPNQTNLIPYSLLVQKQPGAKASEFSSHLSLPATWPVFWRYPDNLSGTSGWDINEALDADKYWSILIDKK